MRHILRLLTVSLFFLTPTRGLLLLAAPQNGKIKNSEESRTEELIAGRQKKLSTVEPAEPSKVVDTLATIEANGIDSFLSFQTGNFRFVTPKSIQLLRQHRLTP